MFQDLRVVGLGATVSYQPTLGSMLNPMNILDMIQTLRHPPVRDILNGFEGVVRPGEMLREFLTRYRYIFNLKIHSNHGPQWYWDGPDRAAALY